jgi:hypothetical protein
MLSKEMNERLNEPYLSIGREKVALKAYEVRRDLTRAADSEAIAETVRA